MVTGALREEKFVRRNNMSVLHGRVLWCIFLVVLASGCGAGADRQGLEGTVTLDGTPLPNGAIRFIPLPETGGPSAGAEIRAGKFIVEPAKGVMRGSFRVEITASRKTDRKVRDRVSGEMTDVFAQFLPPKYNVNSELTADVNGRGPNRYEFALSSR